MPNMDFHAHTAEGPARVQMRRRFFRCLDCLAVFAVEYESLRNIPRYETYECSCGGRIENMGDVRMDRLVKEHEMTACDERCTSARGPVCNCHCGGANHGTHRTVTVSYDCGPVPRVQIGETNEAAGRSFRDQFKAAEAAWKKRYAEIIKLRNRMRWMPAADYARYAKCQADYRLLRKLEIMKVYSLRQRKLWQFTDRMKVEA